MRGRYKRSGLSVCCLALLVGCTSGTTTSSPPSPTPSATASAIEPAPSPAANPAAVNANELGAVPVLMYHQILARPRGVYDQTPAQFTAELTQLYRRGFRTVTAADLVTGRIDLPAGRSPMVLTFDDSTVSQYAELADGSVDPRSAVGILQTVARRFGEQRPVATFYVNAQPFAGKDRYLASLAQLGMELGDHTASHANLRDLDATGVQRELAAGRELILRAVPGASVTTMALPFGAHPRNGVLAHTGRGYDLKGVLLVGSNPAKSPYSRGFDAFAVPRIRSGLRTGDQAFTSTYWLPRLTSTRFISDGDPATVSFPRALAPRLDPRVADRARPY